MPLDLVLTGAGVLIGVFGLWYARRAAITSEKALTLAQQQADEIQKERELTDLEKIILMAAHNAPTGYILYHRHFEGRGPHLICTHARRVKADPSQELVNAFLNHHQIIRFNSHCAGENTAEHNFINGYLCHVGMDPAALLQKPGHFRNIKSGGDYCLIAAPGDNPENYKDCNR